MAFMHESAAITPLPRAISRLSGERFDVLVIGGGITGAGIARDLALRGATVALVEQDDFASGTSSRSTKLIHGGLRYLERFDLGLVFESCRERQILQHVAPHLVRPIPLMIPLYRGARRSKSMIRAGLALYDLLALGRNTAPHCFLSAAEARHRQPLLDPQGLRAAALYWDCRMDDARLCLENIIAAREAGAVTVNYARVTGLLQHAGRLAGAAVEDRETGNTVEVAARVVVNAAGPWLDRVGALSGEWTPRLRPTRGSHLLVPRLPGGDEALYLSIDRDERRFFVIPWGELSLIGTTDLDDSGPPQEVAASAGEIAYLLEETARYLPGMKLAASDVVSTYAGIRPLLAGGPAKASAVSREHALFETANGLIAIGGGKYTTYRAMAATVADRVMARLGRPRGRVQTARQPLPGGAHGWEQLLREPPAQARRHGIIGADLRRLVDRYGARTLRVLALLDQEPALAAPVAPDLPLRQVEVAYAADCEMARTPEDVLRRRTALALQPGHGLSAVAPIADLLGRRLALPADCLDASIAAYRQTYALTIPSF